ncbi:MAG: TonB-dependent receptor [Pseudomonadota bacterium]
MASIRVAACLSTALTTLALLAIPARDAAAQTATPPAQSNASSAPASSSTPATSGVTPANALADTVAGGELQEVEVVSTTPVGPGTNVLDVPSETQTLTSDQISTLNQTTLQDALARRTPGVSTTDAIGSPLSQSVDFRGETASSVPGTPQGLAVYMNGVRINESYGDVVNWDLIPPSAISTAQIVTGNPVFGLNALAGAVVMQMKNGFNYQGFEGDLQGGMDYTVQGSAQYGVNKGDWAYYLDVDGVRTNGFRYFGQSDAERAYGDVGYRVQGNEIHLSMTGGADGLGVAGTTPLELVQQNPWAVFTTPQTTRTTAEMITLSDESHITPTLTFNGNAYFRSYAQAHVDGNVSSFFSCGSQFACDSNGVLDGVTSAPGTTALADPLGGTATPGQPLGEIDSNWTRTLSTGATAQLTDTDKVLGHNNTITGGVSIDHGWTHFTGLSTLGTLPPDFVVTSSNDVIDEPADDVGPVDIAAQNTYIGVYVLDNFNITDKLAVHAGARFNDAQITLNNQLGGSFAAASQTAGTYSLLNASQNFSRINPVVGLSYLITPDISVYASYSEANRAPTPLELGCSSPLAPCMIDNFLVSDPPLKQIVARTVEAGFKGSNQIAWSFAPGRLDWSIAGYRTTNQNDIYSVPSIVTGLGSYTNAGDTLRQGVDVGATYTTEKWDVYANYSYIDARFQSAILLSSPNNPDADANGNIQVEPGDNLPGIPHHKFKFGMDYEVLPGWKVGGDVVYRSGQYYFGDEINVLPQISGFATLNLRTSYQVNKDVQVFGLINNVTNFRGATFGSLYDVGSTQNQLNGNPAGVCDAGLFCSADPRAITLAPPFEAMAGIKVTLNDAPPPAPPLVTKY